MAAGLTQVVTMPFFGALTDPMGTRKKLYLIGTALMALFAFPMFWMVNTGSVALVFLALLIAFTIHAMMYGPQATLYAEMSRPTSATPAPHSATSSPRCSQAGSRPSS
jgi:MFS family permease